MTKTAIFLCFALVAFGCKKNKRVASPNSLENIQTVFEEVIQDISGDKKSDDSQAIVEVLEQPDFKPTQTDLPVLKLTTENQAAIDSKDNYVNGHFTLLSPAGITLADSDLQIKGRGNTTWTMPKKPYRIKLPAKLALLDMPADKDWVLLANYSDKTLLRNAVAFELGNRLGMAYTPRTRFVEVFLNDSYLGVYQLGENIKIGKSRVNINELADTDIAAPKVTGGYLLEVDARAGDPNRFISSKELYFTIQKPEPPTVEQAAYITGYVNNFETQLYADDFSKATGGYQSLIDGDSFINWYLVNEIMKNNDSADFSSIFMHKDKSKPLVMGPLWDFDLAGGNVNYSDARYAEGWWIKTNNRWYARLFDDPNFTVKLKDRWLKVKASALDSIPNYIDEQAQLLKLGQANNFQRWTILSTYVWPNPYSGGTYAAETDYLKNWYVQRINWLDKEINRLP